MHKRLLKSSRRYRLMRVIKRTIGISGYWPLSETTGTTAINYLSGATNSGTVAGATIGQVGKVGRAYDFDGTNDSVTTSNIPAITRVTTFSVFALTLANNVTADHFVCGTRNAGEGFLLWHDDVSSVSTDCFSFFIEEDSGGGSSQNRIETSTGSATTSWQAIVATFKANDASGIRFYVNGIEDANSPVTSSSIANSGGSGNGLRIGEQLSGALDRSGRLQHVAVFNTELSAATARRLSHKAGFI